MSSSAARKTLEKRLGDFLGFDDGVEDVLDHLLSIVSSSDLLDYLEQLLGSRDDKVKAFVEDVGKFQQGLPIETLDFGGSENPSNEGAPQKPSQKPASENKKKSSLAIDTKQKTKNADAMNATKQQPATKGHSAEGNNSVAAKNDQPAAATATAKTLSNKNQNKKDNPNAKKKEQPVSSSKKETGLNVEKEQPKKAHGPPPKGTAKRNCGCFGTLHKPLTNCLYCGRITCEEEGYDFCPFCGYLVEEVMPPEGESDRYVYLIVCSCLACH
jgi:hypothetical protein